MNNYIANSTLANYDKQQTETGRQRQRVESEQGTRRVHNTADERARPKPEEEMTPKGAFNKLADVYDTHFMDTDSLDENDELFKCLRGTKILKGKILDMGCGTGLFLEHMKGIPTEDYTGIDIAENMLQKARQKFSQYNFKQGDMQNLTTLVDTFDTIISLFGSFSYCEHPGAVIAGMAQKLKQNGKFLIMVCTPLYTTRKSHIIYKYKLSTYFKTYTSDELKTIFKRYFSDVAVTPLNEYFWIVTGTQRENLSELTKNITKQYWKNAKTYENYAPHEYIIRDWNPILFKQISDAIKVHGTVEKFKLGKTENRYMYLYLDGYRYWQFKVVLNRTKSTQSLILPGQEQK